MQFDFDTCGAGCGNVIDVAAGEEICPDCQAAEAEEVAAFARALAGVEEVNYLTDEGDWV